MLVLKDMLLFVHWLLFATRCKHVVPDNGAMSIFMTAEVEMVIHFPLNYRNFIDHMLLVMHRIELHYVSSFEQDYIYDYRGNTFFASLL